MIDKGLDLPFVTLVGIVLADAGLALPDLRAGERAFQLLTQVAGRAGRSPLGGRAILQTFDPEHYVIQAAARHDYAGFYQLELAKRRQMGYPPFARLVRLETRQPDAAKAEATAQALAAQLRSWLAHDHDQRTELIGPSPCFFTQVDRQHRWQILLRGPDPAHWLRGRLENLPAEWRIEVDPPSLL
jgi:primosomal protein N' (replication factor Y)